MQEHAESIPTAQLVVALSELDGRASGSSGIEAADAGSRGLMRPVRLSRSSPPGPGAADKSLPQVRIVEGRSTGDITLPVVEEDLNVAGMSVTGVLEVPPSFAQLS